MSPVNLVPEGYTYLNKNTFVSQKTNAAVNFLFGKQDNRDFDMFEMYIYNKEQQEIKEAKDDEDEDEDETCWYEEGRDGADEDYDNDNFVLARVWKAYNAYLQGCSTSTKPLRGPPQWDLSKWSDAQKAPFKSD
ncbi:hypothetical protein EUX98_g3494 [Antrodiella citrinella]|uniref:Uncharacterized protein n=1 Tax=Antrodiella citrinella TaxID=2447956 RepID=A0A4S4MYU9_9APHY|nr:hypothetical protein EUX98_g3494 [Antrodiella citrinella]